MVSTVAPERIPTEWIVENVDERATLRFEADNADVRDERDAENFARGLSAPATEDLGGAVYARRPQRVMTPAVTLRIISGVVASALVSAVACEVKGDLSTPIVPISSALVGMALPSLINLLRARRARPVIRTLRESFVIVVAEGRLELTSASSSVSLPLADLIEVRATPSRLVAVLKTGQRALPVAMPAAQLNALAVWLTEACHSRLRVGYR